MACALDYAHRRGVVHRDVKPDNVLFDEDGNAIITDFGIATARFHGRLTATGRAMGTPHYMSPEQAMGKLVDGRSDIYAIGILLYEALVGHAAVRRRRRVFGELQAGARQRRRAVDGEPARAAAALGHRDASVSPRRPPRATRAATSSPTRSSGSSRSTADGSTPHRMASIARRAGLLSGR